MPKRIYSLTLVLSCALFLLFTLWTTLRPTAVEAATAHTVGVDCPTIQACIDQASAGDQVLIPANDYFETITLNKPVTLTGASAATTRIFPPLGVGRILLITDTAVTSNTVVEGILVARGDLSGGNVCVAPDYANCGGGVLVAGEAFPTLRNMIIQANDAYYGGGIYVARDAGIIMDGVTVLGNTAVQVGGGGVFHGDTTLLSSRFENNRAANSGGGASIAATFPSYPQFPVFISDTIFIDNTAVCTSIFCTLNGGGLSIFELNASIINSRFENNLCSAGNTSGCRGGGLYHSQAFNNVSLLLQNSDFINNSAQQHGGGVLFDATFNDTITVTGGLFQNNSTQTENGGGLFVRDATARISGTQFISNTAGQLGGGFYVLGAAVVQDALFQHNRVITGSGGGLANEITLFPLSMTNTVVQSNTAALNGGGLYLGTKGTISGGSFSGNQALGGDSAGTQEGGGAIYAQRALTLTNVSLVQNSAAQSGGGLYMLNGFPLQVTGGSFVGNEARGQATPFTRGGGGLYTVGNVYITGTQFISNTAVLTNSFNTINLGGAGFIFGTAVFNQIEARDNQSYSAGGAFWVNGSVNITSSQFVRNVSRSWNGGGLSANNGLQIYASTMRENRAGASGGGFQVAGDLTLSQTSLLSNTAASSGGGFWLTGGVDGATVTLTTADIQYNEAVNGSGGGASISVGINGQLTMQDSTSRHNRAGLNGGGIYLNTGLLISNTLAENEASNGGGIYATGLLQLDGTTVLSNTAVNNGGGISSNSNVLLTDALVRNSQ